MVLIIEIDNKKEKKPGLEWNGKVCIMFHYLLLLILPMVTQLIQIKIRCCLCRMIIIPLALE